MIKFKFGNFYKLRNGEKVEFADNLLDCITKKYRFKCNDGSFIYLNEYGQYSEYYFSQLDIVSEWVEKTNNNENNKEELSVSENETYDIWLKNIILTKENDLIKYYNMNISKLKTEIEKCENKIKTIEGGNK